MNRIKKNDMVFVIGGKDKGRTGKVLKIFPAQNKAIVEKINIVKKHMKQTKQDRPGGIIAKENPIHLSNLMPYCAKCKSPTRIGYKVLKDGSKIRICQKCKEVI